MKRVLIAIAVVLAALILAGVGFYVWAGITASRKLSRTIAAHTVDFPIPFPADEQEVRRRRLTPDAAAQLAATAALERGRHLIEARYGCAECHGRDFSGGVMIDVPAIGRLLGPNLTAGNGSRVTSYGAADWDRIVRHGIKLDGRPAVMPSGDYRLMSDRELSDIVFFIRSQPRVDNEVPAVSLGPVGKLLVATGQFVLSADAMESHDRPHAVLPPDAAGTVEFGRHLAATCTGCHGEDLAGGPIVGGDPSWPPAANLTPHATGLGGWTPAQFVTLMRQGTRPDGTALAMPMAGMVAFAQKMTDVELEAMWRYLQSLPAVASQE